VPPPLNHHRSNSFLSIVLTAFQGSAYALVGGDLRRSVPDRPTEITTRLRAQRNTEGDGACRVLSLDADRAPPRRMFTAVILWRLI